MHVLGGQAATEGQGEPEPEVWQTEDKAETGQGEPVAAQPVEAVAAEPAEAQ